MPARSAASSLGGGCGWIIMARSPATSASGALGSSIMVRLAASLPGQSTSSRLMVCQRISRHGTPYSKARSPLASTDMVVWKLRQHTFRPIRSAGTSMPALTLTNMWFWLNRRRGNTGVAV